ncbi:unnamed protein product [Auanema sp. JU1783]|nr:unnamed protein product [Auanema sp. JU1783]
MWLLLISVCSVYVRANEFSDDWDNIQNSPIVVPQLRLYRILSSPEKKSNELKRDMSVYPSAGSQLMPRIPLREPPLKRSDKDYFVERRTSYPLDMLRVPLREPPLKKRSMRLPYPPILPVPVKEPPFIKRNS